MREINFTYAHAAILVSNLERSVAFYERAVGWTKTFDGSYGDSLGQANRVGGGGRIVMGKLGGVPLEFVEMRAPLEKKDANTHYGIFMCSVAVPDLKPVRERLAEFGIAITREVDVETIRLLVLTDPDGQEIGIIGPRNMEQA